MRTRFLALIAFSLLAPTADTAAKDETDHPLVTPYEGSVLRRKDVKEFDEYRLITGTDGKEFSGPKLEGKISKILYANPEDRSLLEMYRNYQSALLGAGAEILFECDQGDDQGCLERYAGPGFQKYSDIHAMSNLKGRFVSAKLQREGEVAYIALAVGPTFTNVHVIEIAAMDEGMANVNAEALGQGIDRDGYVVVEGIFFDTDRATLKSDSNAALEEVARLLRTRPELELYVVGHTDMQGALDHNMQLSKGRADAVVGALVERFGIDAKRLQGFGVGPLAPQAANSSEGGRARNRRVVLVGR